MALMHSALTIQVPLDASFFLQNESRIDHLLEFSDWATLSQDQDLRSAVELLVPVGCRRNLIRVGGNGDGAYLLPDHLEGIEACFSPGVSTIIDFETDLARQYAIPSYLCDASVEATDLALDPLMQRFSRKWLGSFDDDNTQSLDAWVLGSDHADSHELLLQMDIEASEYNALLAVSDSVLERFRILVIEFHRLDALQSSRFLNTRFLPVLRKLLAQFDCVHAHANNCLPAVNLSGYDVPPVLELTFYRKWENQGDRRPWRPNALDVLNVPSNPPLLLGAPWV
ncbi:MAG: hypothetical protein ACKOZT_08335 [Cyanobium sp.]